MIFLIFFVDCEPVFFFWFYHFVVDVVCGYCHDVAVPVFPDCRLEFNHLLYFTVQRIFKVLFILRGGER